MTGLRFDTNNQWLVRRQAPRVRVPAIVRFERRLKEVWVEGQELPCLLWQKSGLFRVDGSKLIRPWKFAWEHFTGKKSPKGAGWSWTCPNEHQCCQWKHVHPKGKHCKDPDFIDDLMS